MGIREGTAVMVLALALTACESGFSEADIEQTKQEQFVRVRERRTDCC